MHIPALNSPEKAFEYILSTIICTEPEIWLAKVKPVLLTFISHPIIKELIGQSEVPAQAKNDNSPNLDLQKIQDSLQQLSKAVEALKKAPPPSHISASLSCSFNLPSNSPLPQPRPNTKWSKITINGVPTGASNDRSPLSPDECHMALAASNPSYTSLSITQKPSWVRPPSSYKPGSISSLSLAFEDPDGSKLRVLLAECYLYALGNRASVLKWKYHQANSKAKSKFNTSKHPNAGDTNDNKDVNNLLTTPATGPASPTPHSLGASLQTVSAPPVQSSQPTQRSARATWPPRPFDA